MTKAIFSTSSFPTVEYISLALRYDIIELEQYENFQKQSNRSRFHILSPNAIQTLAIPLRHHNITHSKITEVEISYLQSWQRLHWRSIQAAYNRSPFFEFYKDELQELFFFRETYLFGFNLKMFRWILKALKKSPGITLTESYEKQIVNGDDFRNLSSSKNTAVIFPQLFIPKKYNQVFSYKNNFIPNLSVLDLIFNCGNETVNYLQEFEFLA